MAKKGFLRKPLAAIKNIGSWKNIFTTAVLIKTWVIIASIIIIFMIGRWGWTYATSATKSIAQQITIFASKQIGEPLQTDEFGNINVLVGGYAGDGFRGGVLTDTIMLASYNVDMQAVTFLSIPRDFYVNYGNGRTGKINGLYANAFATNGNDHHAAAEVLAEKVSEITGVDIPYYAVVDFAGFVTFVDTLGGIDIDVPERIYDNSYPGPNDSYIVFAVDPGMQNFDGEKALKFARSRMSTSDFSRSLRQQLIIEAIVDKATRLGNIHTIIDLYENLDDVIKTNVTGKEMLWLGQFTDVDKHYFSYVYTAECNKRVPDLTAAGCYLYFGDRNQFGGMSVLLPQGSSASNLSYYTHTKDFAFWVVHNQGFLKENAEIRVLNGIDMQEARAGGYRVSGVATELAIELILKGFSIDRITNAEEPSAVTKLVVPGDGRYPETVKTLAAFVDYKEVITDPSFGSGVSIVIGTDYLKNM